MTDSVVLHFRIATTVTPGLDPGVQLLLTDRPVKPGDDGNN
jgi:hypothetical protein